MIHQADQTVISFDDSVRTFLRMWVQYPNITLVGLVGH